MVQIQCNVGGPERTARISAGAALLGIGLATPIPKPYRIAADVVGGISLVTGLIQWCPISQAMHRNTCPTGHKPHD